MKKLCLIVAVGLFVSAIFMKSTAERWCFADEFTESVIAPTTTIEDAKTL